jgi:hypothetical protein
MLEEIKKYPDKMLGLTDDARAKKLLFELGIIDKFSKSVPGVERPVQAVTGICTTHYILALLFSGQEMPEDNGYVVYCLPKSFYSPDAAMLWMRKKVEEIGGTPLIEKAFPRNSSEN